MDPNATFELLIGEIGLLPALIIAALALVIRHLAKKVETMERRVYEQQEKRIGDLREHGSQMAQVLQTVDRAIDHISGGAG